MIVEIAGLICILASIAVIVSNHKRRTNWIVATLFLLIAASHATIIAGFWEISIFGIEPNAPYYPWRRANAAILAFAPCLVALLHNAITSEAQAKNIRCLTIRYWTIIGILFFIICFFESFIFKDSKSLYAQRGMSYFIYSVLASGAYAILLIKCYRSSLRLTGIHGFEMRFVAFDLALAGLTTIIATGVGNVFQSQSIRRLIFAFFSGFVLASTWAMISSKIYNVRQIFMLFAQRFIFVILLTFGAISIWYYYGKKAISSVDILFIIIIFGSGILWLEIRSKDWFDTRGERILAQTRRLTIELAQGETDPSKLAEKFEVFLSHHFHSNFAMLLFKNNDAYIKGNFAIHKQDSYYVALCETGWATPENLVRRRSKSSIIQLRRFVDSNSIGLITTNPRGSQNPSLLMILGQKRSPWPFTYPEVQRLQNVGELIDNILTHSRLTAQAALTARMEHLAMMSRGLAHDLKNLITPVSSFLIHTDDHFPPSSPEGEVHAAARRSVRIMTDYVREALFFSERLAPNFQTVGLARLFQTVAEITASRAARHGISVALAENYSGLLVADSVLLQRMLGNLVSNAIDASQTGQKVTVSVSQTISGKVRFQVKDEGIGIAPENLGRIFDPYFTTKEFGEDVRGFGLGLTICQKIAHLHGGTIFVDSEVGRGTTISVDLPSAPPSTPPDQALLDRAANSRHSTFSR